MTNADIHKTPQERAKAFNAFCAQYMRCSQCPLTSTCGMVQCAFAWLELGAQQAEDAK